MDTVSPAVQAYVDKTPKSAALYPRARDLFPSGITHDTRYLKPYPLAISHAEGSRKWDIDGNEYVDYFGGHGALLLGHAHPAMVEAVQTQLVKGSHYGASHKLEVEWAELVTQLIPSAEKVRFTGSGTEASLLGLRVARAYTGKPRIVRFVTHFHGWHDGVAFAASAGYDGTLPAGISPEAADGSVLCPPNDLDQLRQILETRDDIAAVVLEPTGASFGRVPTSRGFLAAARELTHEHGALLIFDEVVTGFRCATGGAQGHFGITPDLTFLAKIVAGGLPGGALTGRADIMDAITFSDDPNWNKTSRVPHQGTFNASPVCAAAGIAMLSQVATTDVTERANRTGEALRKAMNDVAKEEDVNWLVYGEFSGFHILPLDEDQSITLEDIYSGKVGPEILKGGTPLARIHEARCGLMAEGVDIIPWPGGVVSAVHTEEDVARTAEAYRGMLRMCARVASV
jgi:glutamate-1-semialdehyde 2,1-aminomutase